MEMREWLSIIVIIAIVLILLDGFRRKWMDRRRDLRVKLDKSIPASVPLDLAETAELPNGGARVKPRDLDEDVDFDAMDDFTRDEEDLVPEDDFDVDEEDPSQKVTVDFDDVEDEDFDADTEDADDLPDDPPALEPDEEAFDDDGVTPVRSRTRTDRIEPTFGDLDAVEDAELLEREKGAAIARNAVRGATRDAVKAEAKPGKVKSALSDWQQTRKTRAEARDAANESARANEKEVQRELLFEQQESQEEDRAPEPHEVIIINVMARPGEMFAGRELLPILRKQHMQLGDMSIFHRHADAAGNGPVMFSMANMVKPGTFDISKMDEFSTPGVSFFMQLPRSLGNMKCFDQMLAAATAIKDGLDGELKDENRSVITRQTVEHSRQRIRDFELAQLSRRQQ